MTYVLRVHVPEAEPYTGLWDEEDVREAVREEVRNTISELASDILDENTEEERIAVEDHLTDVAVAELWRLPQRGADRTYHRLPGRIIDNATNRRAPGVLLSLEED